MATPQGCEDSNARTLTDKSCSETTWKLKLKEWDFNKKISTHDWQWMHLKRRERVQAGIETRFFHRLVEVTPEMFEDFEKRKTEPVTLNIGT